MPGNYTLELELFSLLNGSVSDFEIYADGALLGGYSTTVSSAGSTISVSVPYGGVLPTSLEFRFTDSAPGSMDTIEVRAVKINDRYVNTGNYLSGTILNDGGSQTVDVTNNAFLFDASEPSASEFTTGATQTYTAGADTYRDYTNSTPQVFDMLGGRDVAYLGNGADKVNGNGGNDILHGRGGADLLYGAAGNDRLFGGDGDDTLYGGDDNDRIQGDAGDDEIHGGAGVDRLIGGADNDVITGGTGNDTIVGGSGDDYLFGDGDDDTIIGGTGADTIDGGSGADIAYGGAGIDHINGGADDDILIGNGGDDVIHGDGGDDIIYGLEDDDTIFGGAGDDFIDGGIGADTIDGGTENDILKGGAGIDIIDGGAGDDILHGHSLTTQEVRGILNANAGVVYNGYTNSFYLNVTGGANYATAYAAATGMNINGIAGHLVNVTSADEQTYITTQVMTGGEIWIGASDEAQEGHWEWTDGAEAGLYFWEGGPANFGGVAIANTYNSWPASGFGGPNNAGAGQDLPLMYAGGDWDDTDGSLGWVTYVIEWDAGLINDDGAIDTLTGGAGNDTIYGYGGDDVLDGGADDDVIFGGDGDDTIDGGDGVDNILGGNGVDNISGGDGNDIIDGGADVDTIAGNNNDDLIYGGAGDDILDGDAGDDVIYGEDDNDIITGGLNNDYIHGGDGDDDVQGNDGTDTLVGGSGADTLDGGAGNDVLHGHGLSSSQINLILDNNADVRYFSETNSFYQYVNSGVNHATALAAANASIIDGVAGHLVNITSQAENDFLSNFVFLDSWTGGSDINNDTQWAWQEGLEAGVHYSTGSVSVNGSYTNWEWAQPNGSEYQMVRRSNSQWEDNLATDNNRYIIEWDAGFMNDDNSIDTLSGGAGNDKIYGYGGNDVLDGGNDDDMLIGGAGDDILLGGAGDDFLSGGDGNDLLIGSTGVDTIDGGDGDDTIVGIEGQTLDITTLNSYGGGQDVGGTVTFEGNGVTLDGNLWKKFDLNYTVTANTIVEFDYRSTLEPEIAGIGFDTDDIITNPRHWFKVHGDQFNGGGNQTYDNYDGSGDWVHYRIDVGSFYTGIFDRFYIMNDDDGSGTDGNSSFANIVIYEDNAADTSADILNGGNGDDRINGNNGDNIIAGGDGLDTIYGYGGADTFVFEDIIAFNDIDEIIDFDTGENDAIDLTDLLSGYSFGSDDITDFVQILDNGANSDVYVDTGGTGTFIAADQIATLFGVTGLTDELALETAGNLITH